MKNVLILAPGILTLTLAALHGGDWPQWRGPERDGHATVDLSSPKTLPTDLQPRWKIGIGPGYSSPVVAKGKVVFLDEIDDKEVVHLIEADTGKELWKTSLDASFGDNWGSGPRATPIIDEDRVYVQSCRGEFRCLDLSNGRTIWKTNFEKDYGVRFVGSKANEGTASRRGNNGCGVIDEERIYVPVGATGASIVCFHKLTGKELWRSQDDEAAYSSLIVGRLAGEKQVIAFTADALIGLDLATGKLFWRVPFKTNAKRHVATPVVVGDTVLVNSHTIGLVATRVAKTKDGFTTREAWTNKDLKINLATPVLVGQSLYVQGADKDYVCVDAMKGVVQWRQAGFGAGAKDYSSTIVVGNQLLVLTEDGTLLLLTADPRKYSELGRLQVCGNTWSFPAYANGRLFVRDARNLSCIDLLPVKTAGR